MNLSSDLFRQKNFTNTYSRLLCRKVGAHCARAGYLNGVNKLRQLSFKISPYGTDLFGDHIPRYSFSIIH